MLEQENKEIIEEKNYLKKEIKDADNLLKEYKLKVKLILNI